MAGKQVARKDAPEWQDLVEKYERVAKNYDAIAASVAAFDVRRATAVSSAIAGVSDIIDPELRRNAEEARAALERREQVTASFVADWRTSSRATSSYARRIEAGLLHGDKDACAPLPRGVAAKSPAQIVVSCHKAFEARRAELDERLSILERLARL